MENRHVISILVQNRPGVLTRISGLFSRRGYNIDSLSVCATEDENFSRMTITVCGSDRILSQILSQLEKQVDVEKIADFSAAKSVFRELLIIKIHCTAAQRAEIVDICTIFKAKTIDISPDDSMIVELTGESAKIDAFIEILRSYGVLEMARTGGATLERGKNTLLAK
jgi:acetolactate synthase, small subunit